jgi:hypothetical protein
MDCFVYTVIGSQVNTRLLKEQVDRVYTREKGIPIQEVMEDVGLKLIDAAYGTSFVCTRSHAFQVYRNRLLNYGPLVIYQDSNWDKEKVRRFLESLDLWMPGQFGLWTFAVPTAVEAEESKED